MLAIILLALSSLHPSAEQQTARVDLIEVNHYHDDTGRHVFDQMIFYEWEPVYSRYHVREWRLAKSETRLPRRDYRAKVWRVVFYDAGEPRIVEATEYRETWTQYDPELVNREHLPQEARRPLWRRR